jgi:hypothetical protein
MMLFERVEQMEVDHFMTKSQRHRDRYLLKSPADELVCFFYFMTVEDYCQCFSEDTIYACFKKMPSTSLMTLCQHVPPHQMTRFLSKADFCKKWVSYRPDYLHYELRLHSHLLFGLINYGYVTYKDMYPPFHDMTMTELSILYSTHSQWKIMLGPLFASFHRIFNHLPYDMVNHIVSFLFVEK